MKRRGFTIIELLVVLAIIAIIASVVLALFGGPKAKGRDARRLSDMKEIHNALSLFVNNFGTYPDCPLVAITGVDDCLSKALRDAGVMSTVPRDQVNVGTCSGLPDSPDPKSSVYCYKVETNGTSFSLFYHLETDTAQSMGWHTINP